jgi:hypothetical protein
MQSVMFLELGWLRAKPPQHRFSVEDPMALTLCLLLMALQ